MILIDRLPCKDCKHYKGVAKPDGTEKTEMVKCMIADQKNAANKLKGQRCDEYEKNERKKYSV
jgi:hypothetical protein